MDSYVYILANGKNGAIYIGVTDNLVRRVYEHKHSLRPDGLKNDLVKGFTKKYEIHELVYYEVYKDIKEAILREKQMKKWKRYWKIKLINKMNPAWSDLYSQIV